MLYSFQITINGIQKKILNLEKSSNSWKKSPKIKVPRINIQFILGI